MALGEKEKKQLQDKWQPYFKQIRGDMLNAQKRGDVLAYNLGIDQLRCQGGWYLCKLYGGKYDDPLQCEAWEAVSVYEGCFTLKANKSKYAFGTRRGLRNKGVVCFYTNVLGKNPNRPRRKTNGFKILNIYDRYESLIEYLVVKYAKQFPQGTVQIGRDRLDQLKVPHPQPVP